MSGVTYWLQKQRKGELVDLARYVGMKKHVAFKDLKPEIYDNLLKTDLEVALEEHLRANSTKYAQDPKLEPYYRRQGVLSPVKRETGSTLISSENENKRPQRGRRQTRGAREETEAPSDSDAQPAATSTALSPRTPRTSLSFARNLPLPPSPAVLADRIDASTTSIRATLSNFVSDSPVPSTLYSLRSSLSSVTSVELLTLFIEAYGLRAQVMPLRYLTTIPPIPALGLTGETAVKIPDLFALLTAAFWGPVGLWLVTSLFVPLAGAWFFNFSSAKGYDPLSFHIVKALTAWIVFARQGYSGKSRAVVEEGVPGGVPGMMVGAGVGALVSFWDVLGRR